MMTAAAGVAGCGQPDQQVTAVDAERAFAADAQRLGQWTAFRKWSAERALMFTPQPVNPHEFLKDKKDPPAALTWSPGASYVSCDGSYAINTGPWTAPGGKAFGYFTTVWERQPGGGWKWVYDGGDTLKQPRPRPEQVTIRRASCDGKPPPLPIPVPTPGFKSGQGQSPDNSLHWTWSVGAQGERRFVASLWNGRSFVDVILDRAVPPQ